MALEEQIVQLLVKISEKLDALSVQTAETNKVLSALDTTMELIRIEVTNDD